MSTSFPLQGEADKRIGAFEAPLSVCAQDIPNMTVKIRAGSFFNSLNVFTEFGGGSSPVITPPVSSVWWVLVTLTDAGSIGLVYGSPALAPSFPTIPSGNIPIAAVYVTSTTIAITTGLISDVRPFLRSTDIVPNIEAMLADFPTFTDLNNDLALKADVGGTPSMTFTLNENLVGPPSGNMALVANRGTSPNVSIRWNESVPQWELTNDGTLFSAIATTVSPTNFVAITGSTMTGLLVLSGDPVAALGAATKQYVDTGVNTRVLKTGDTMTGNLTVATVGGMPNMLYSAVGEAGIEVTRSADITHPAFLKWDETSLEWEIGRVGISSDSILTSTIVATKADKVVGATAGHFASLDGTGNLVDSGDNAATFATAAQGALASTALQPAAIGVTVEGYDATILKSSAIGVTVEGYDATILKSSAIGVTVEGYDATILKSAAIGVTVEGYDATILKSADIGSTVEGYDATILKSADIGSTVEGYDATILKSADIGVTVEGYDATILKSAAIGVTVEGYDATILKSADIGSTVEGYDATILKSADIGSTVEGYDATILKSADIGSTVEGYDATILKSADIGSTVEAWSAELDAVAGIATTGFVRRTGAHTWSASGLTGTEVNSALGYTAANDASVVHNTGNESVGGIKTFTTYVVLPAVSKTTLSALGSGNATEPIGSTLFVTDDTGTPHFIMAWVDGTHTWVRSDTGAAIS